jgi:hypothetical protein
MTEHRLLSRWIRATWAGWVLGVPVIVALALIGEAIGIGGAQALVGAGMGIAVGFLQARAIRGVLPGASRWFWSCAVGLAIPFLVTDIWKPTGLSAAYSLFAAVALGGVVIGAWQSLILRSRLRRAGWWMLASAVGWVLAGAMAAAADPLSHAPGLRGIWGALAYLGIIAGGGLILGLVTGAALVWMLRDDVEQTRATVAS